MQACYTHSRVSRKLSDYQILWLEISSVRFWILMLTSLYAFGFQTFAHLFGRYNT